jgi:hypothetical protein
MNNTIARCNLVGISVMGFPVGERDWAGVTLSQGPELSVDGKLIRGKIKGNREGF